MAAFSTLFTPILYVFSIASLKAHANRGSYAISKFSLLEFSKMPARRTKRLRYPCNRYYARCNKNGRWNGVEIPEERFLKPSDIADTVYAAYLLSNRSVIEEIVIRPQLGDL